MSSSRGQYHQDYIARIRYSNALPPPPFPPKLLEIPHDDLANGLYTSAGFASRLSRDQPLNIEADAELGMRIDLVGLPGVFDGDEKAISYPDPHDAPPLDPKDRALLRPLASLGKATANPEGVSFLRRTEYIFERRGTDRRSGAGANPLLRSANSTAKRRPAPERKPAEVVRKDPESIPRAVEKAFALANPDDVSTGAPYHWTKEEKDAWQNPKYPEPGTEHVTLLDEYPLVPDFDAFTDSGPYLVLKYQTNPLRAIGTYDRRLDHALLRPVSQTPEQEAAYIKAQDMYNADPLRNPFPIPQNDFQVFLPDHTPEYVLHGLKRKFEQLNEGDESAYTHGIEGSEDDQPHLRYQYLRVYETYQATGEPSNPFNEVVAIALHDGGGDDDDDDNDDDTGNEDQRSKKKMRKAAYIYPVGQRASIRPRREKREDLEKIDIVEFRVHEPTEEEQIGIESVKRKYKPPLLDGSS